MKRSVLIGIAALAFACGGGSHQSDTREGAASGTSAQPNGSAQAGGANAAGAQTGGDQGGATQANQTVTLVGCLIGPGQPTEPRGTSAARARARATGPETAVATTGAGATADRFMLVDAVVPGADLGGVGANGAGGSGGPLVSGKATFELDGVPGDASANVNKQVKVVGRLDARPADATGGTEAAGAAGAGARESGGASSGNASSGVLASGTNGAGSGAPAASGSSANSSGSSDAPGAHGNGQKSVAGHGTMGAAARSDLRNQRLVVESVQVVANNCAAR